MLLLPCTPDDLPQVQALARRIWWDHYPAIITPEQIEYMLEKSYALNALRQQLDAGHVIRLVYPEPGAEPVGFISIGPQEAPGSYFLHKFYVEVREHGKGFGAEAFHLALAQYPDLRELRLLVNRSNYKSVNFYFKVGFKIEKCIVTDIGQGFVMDDFQMIWRRSGA
jgi:diamine N-acetyltransferase